MGCLVDLLVAVRRDSLVAVRLWAVVVVWAVEPVVTIRIVVRAVIAWPQGVHSLCRILHLLEAARRSIRRILP